MVTGVVMAVLIGGLGVWLVLHRSATPASGQTAQQLRVDFGPAVRPAPGECIHQLQRLAGISAGTATGLCAAGRHRSWFTATITNSGDGAYPVCTATAYEHDLKVAFRGRVPLIPSGPYIPPHQTISVTWYLPRAVPGGLATMVGACTAATNVPK